MDDPLSVGVPERVQDSLGESQGLGDRRRPGRSTPAASFPTYSIDEGLRSSV
jgi:hypothetical protein